MNRLFIMGVAAVAVMAAGCAGENANEKLADQITAAVRSNDVSSVSGKFVPAAREKMDHQSVGRLSDQLTPLGKFERTYEKTPDTAPAGTHFFNAKFEKQTWHERLALNNKGEIIGWDIRPGPLDATAK